jgi:hypothetical protein
MDVSGQLHTSAALPPEKEPPGMDKRLGGPHSRSGRGGEEKKSQPQPGIEPLSSSQKNMCNGKGKVVPVL